MKRLALALILISVLPTSANAAGVATFEVPGGADGPAIKAMMWTPCAAAPGDIKLGDLLVLPGVRDCPIAGEALPLIVISHGFGGSAVGHHDTAEVLADAGFAVVALNHPFDSDVNTSHSNAAAALTARPQDVKRLIDYMLGPSPVAVKLDHRRIGFFGFSRGGYTGLMLAGAVPDYPFWPPFWLLFHASALWGPTPVEQASDPRIKAFVIADPVAVFPTAENLRYVTAPIQLWASHEGGQGVTPDKVATVARNLPVKPEYQAVPNSTHLSFLMPCPPALAKAVPDICTDPAGFDREAFHKDFNAQVLAFLRKALAE